MTGSIHVKARGAISRPSLRAARPLDTLTSVSSPKPLRELVHPTWAQALEPVAADVARLVSALTQVQEKVRFCEVCFNVAQEQQCRICRDPRRDAGLVCVVEEPKDIVAIERTREFRGRYHVLGGAISPIDGVGPNDLRITELMARLGSTEITEVIIATDPNLEGEATASYLARLLAPMGLRVSRLASGLPVGGDLEYADEVTLGRAFEGRRMLSA